MLGSDPANHALSFWMAVSSCIVFYAWGTIESFLLARTLHKRAKLGMSDPIVVNRALRWGLSGLFVVLMSGISVVSAFVNGPEVPASWSTVLSLLGVLSAVAIDGMSYHVYGGLMTQSSVVYNRAFIGYAYRLRRRDDRTRQGALHRASPGLPGGELEGLLRPRRPAGRRARERVAAPRRGDPSASGSFT